MCVCVCAYVRVCVFPYFSRFVQRFNTANSMARKYFKAQKFDLAADQYGIALSLCDKLPNHEEKRTALHNNRCVCVCFIKFHIAA